MTKTKATKQIFMPLVTVFLMFAILVTPTFASEVNSDNELGGQIYYTKDGLEAGVIYEYQSQASEIQARIPNVIKLVASDAGKDKVRIYVRNIGVDKFDKVACYVRIYNKNSSGALIAQHGATLTFTNIYPTVVQQENFSVPNWKLVEVTNIKCMDGSDYQTLPSFSLSKK